MSVDSNMSILVVDDYSTMVRIMRKLLKQCGFENVDEASYGLVITDWNMEPMTGFEVLKAVRADEKTSSLPVILVTAESKADNIEAAKQAGVNGYLVKPFTAPVLMERIEAALKAA